MCWSCTCTLTCVEYELVPGAGWYRQQWCAACSWQWDCSSRKGACELCGLQTRRCVCYQPTVASTCPYPNHSVQCF